MHLHKHRPELPRSESNSVPDLTHQPSLESVRSPTTPGDEPVPNPLEKRTPTIKFAGEVHNTNSVPSSPKVPSKDLPFLSEDPYANTQDDDIIPFDKNKPIIPSRSGSVRSILSNRSVQSLKRGLSSLKRKLTTSRRRKPRRQNTDSEAMPAHSAGMDEDGIQRLNRAQTYMMGPTFQAPRRVETYQVAAMAM